MTISISLNGVLIDFTKAEKVSALLYNEQQQTYCPIASSAKKGEATTLVCLADASSHCYNGVYKLVVRLTVDGTSVEYDIPAFNGVDTSLEMGDDYGSLKTIELTINAEKFTATTGVLQKLIDKMEAGEAERVTAEQTRQAQEQQRETNTNEAITGANEAAKGANNAASKALEAAKKFAEAIVQQTGMAADKVMSQKAVTEICEALAKAIELKQEKLTAGKGISIEGGVISSTLDINPFVVVSSLPATGDSEKIYLVPAEKPEEGNLTDEWIWNNGQWERLGSAKVDLTAYAKTEDVKAALEAKQDTISDLEAIRSGASKGATALQEESDPVYLKDKPSLALKSEIPDISGKVDKEEGKSLSSNDYTDSEKAKLAGLQNYDDSEVRGLIAQKADDADLAEVAKTGKYEDLIGEPVVESPKQPTGGESVWVNPDEDTEEVEVYSRRQTDALINTRQEELTLTVKDNGNIVIGNIMGQTKEFMPATPSGDPMHWAYVAAGAEYNDTGADIIKTAPWADLADDEADKTVVHKAGYWYLNGLGDITNTQIRYIYSGTHNITRIGSRSSTYPDSSLTCAFFANTKIRTNFPFSEFLRNVPVLFYTLARTFQNSIFEVVIMPKGGHLMTGAANYYSFRAQTIKHILNPILLSDFTDYDTGLFFSGIKTFKISGLNKNIQLILSPRLTLKTILYMIQNEAATSAITITLHADAYARAMASDEIVAALAEHPNVSLASA